MNPGKKQQNNKSPKLQNLKVSKYSKYQNIPRYQGNQYTNIIKYINIQYTKYIKNSPGLALRQWMRCVDRNGVLLLEHSKSNAVAPRYDSGDYYSGSFTDYLKLVLMMDGMEGLRIRCTRARRELDVSCVRSERP